MALARRIAQAALLAALLVSAVVIAWRTLAGPIESPIAIHSPLNAESVFGLAALLLLCLRSLPDSEASPASRKLGGRDTGAMVGIAVVVIAAFWTSARDYFVSDDFILIKYGLSGFHYLRQTFFSGGGDGFYRPLIYATFAATPQWMGLNPVWWHSIGFAIHAANSILVYLLVWKLGASRFAAGLAAALFALHATRPEVVVWITGRFDLIATFFVLLALVCLAMAVDATGSAWIAWLGTSLAAMVLGLMSKESAYACPLAILVLLAAKNAWKRWRLTVPFFAVAAAMFLFRWSLFGGIGGYVNAAGRPEASSINLVLLLKALMLRLEAILFFPVNWSIAPGFWLGAAMVLYLIALVKISTTRIAWRAVAIPLGLLFVLVLPVLQRILIGVDLEKARYLYLPSVGFCLLLATVIDRMGRSLKWLVTAAVLGFNAIALGHNSTAWHEAAEKANDVCGTVAQTVDGPGTHIAVFGLPRTFDGAYFFANGLPECVALRTGVEASVKAFPADASESGEFTAKFSWDEHTGTLVRMR